MLELKPEMLCQGHHRRATVLKSQVATEVTLNYKDIITRIEKIEKTLKTDQQHQNYNSHRIDEAFELLHQILQDTQKTNNNLIGFRPKTSPDKR
ncbi:MAG: hypothetical protein PHS65_08780 [Arcobacteraceae bacterium]|nr:hypothetical protein [Arcobacteraceae bacterium]